MNPFELLAQTSTPDGTTLKLIRRSNEFLILAGTAVLMSSRTHGSEDALATLACQRARSLPHPTVLIGGLGMGFTLRATLNLLPPHATVVVAELLPAIVEWNQGPLAPLAGHPLQDPRVRVETADVSRLLNSSRAQFDAILLDVDNGPAALSATSNASLYNPRGIAAAHAALRPQGILAVWSARDDRKFAQRLRAARFQLDLHHPRSRQSTGTRHTIFLAHKS